MESNYFVKLDDPTPLRILLLEASKEALVSGKYFIDLKDIRKRKAEALEILDNQIATLTADFTKLESMLPHKELINPTKPKKSKSTKKKKTSVTKPVNKNISELEKIDAALAAIEEKINNLT